jgi:hypothetical protein
MAYGYDQALFTITSAVIPNVNNPTQQVRDRNGNYPSTIHEDGVSTWEECFQKFGKKVVGCYVSVDQRATHLEHGVGHIVYVGKPVSANFPPGGPYGWA